MDEYDKKFAEMQKYIPFLEAMIERLQNVKDKSREVQLQKMQSLHGILSNSKRKIRIETLQRCEDVLQKLHNKVEKFQGNTPGLNFPNKKGEENTSNSSNSSEKSSSKHQKKIEKPKEEKKKHDKEKKMDETPASPSPPVSPETVGKSAPIIIPTERSTEFLDSNKSDSKPASPDQTEKISTKAPIIIPTERNNACDLPSSSKPVCATSSNKGSDETAFAEWELLEESEKQNPRNKSWQPPTFATSHDVAAAAKLVGESLTQKSQKEKNEGRSHSSITPRHIPAVPVASLSGSRKITAILEKNKFNIDVIKNSLTRAESPPHLPEVKIRPPIVVRQDSPPNVSEIRLRSPDPEIFSPKPKIISPKKELYMSPKSCAKPHPVSLLVSPPPVSTEPLLTAQDLADLLCESSEGKDDKKTDRKEDAGERKERDRSGEEINKDDMSKFMHRKPSSSMSSSSNAKGEPSKSNEIKGPPIHHNVPSMSMEKMIDHRNQLSSPTTRIEQRYADNYERHSRNYHGHEEMPIPVQHLNGPPMQDDRNSNLYHRRMQPNVVPEMVPPPRIEPDFRMDNSDFYNRQHGNQGHWHPPPAPNDFQNNQWIPPPNYKGGPPNPPMQNMQNMPNMQSMPNMQNIPNMQNMQNMPNMQMPYQHPHGMHQDMWNVPPAPTPVMEPHPINDPQVRPNQYASPISSGMPLMSPTSRPQDMNQNMNQNMNHDMSNMNVPVMQPMMSPPNYPVGPQYRGFQPENRPYEVPFDNQNWGQNEIPCAKEVPVGPSSSFSRPNTPCTWNNRDRGERSGRGRGRDTYYNERNRDSRNNFNREGRRSDWSRDSHQEWDNSNRFNRDTRPISERDPRMRLDYHNNGSNSNSSSSRNNIDVSVSPSARDPRLAKDKHSQPSKSKDSSYNDRDPRKRASVSQRNTPPRKTKEKPKLQRSPEPPKSRSVDSNEKPNAKDAVMQSPLESLYGVIDTKGKSGPYSLQKFKIPKIKRPEPPPSPPSDVNETKVVESSHSKKDRSSSTDKKADEKKSNEKSSSRDEVNAEVTSSSDAPVFEENWDLGIFDEESAAQKKNEAMREVESCSSATDEGRDEVKIGEADSVTNITDKPAEIVEEAKKDNVEAEAPKLKDDVTQELIEALLRKSLQFGEGKLIQKLGEALHAKKLKKIKKIIESSSESSSSDKDEPDKPKKGQTRKKRRVIVSDSSDDECLAERLSVLGASEEKSEEQQVGDEKDTEQVLKNDESIVQAQNTSKDRNLERNDVLEEHIKDEPKQAIEIKDLIETEQVSDEVMTNKEDMSCSSVETFESKDKNDESREENQEDKDEAKESAKAQKPKAKRRNSLEMLQEDIREMFISEGVVTATGHRMCRVIKENQVTTNLPGAVIKKDEGPITSEKLDSNSESEESTPVKSKKVSRSRNNEEQSKDKTKTKKEARRVTRQRSKEPIQSSDSEEDQPLALRTEMLLNFDSTDRTSEASKDDALRRSKRVLDKVIKEPRVLVEKTDISKIDSSKVMFDSSSDESFGIDVSELAAAVDVSLHPDKQSGQVVQEEIEPPKKPRTRSKAKKLTRKRSASLLTDDKDDASFTDESSVISDVSMSSSVASSRKLKSNNTDTNEELLSNILVGLTPSKSNSEKDTSIDKPCETDIEEDVTDPVPVDQVGKKVLVKKKKKRLSWKMGILTKKKKKKAIHSTPPVLEPIGIINDPETTETKDPVTSEKSVKNADDSLTTKNDSVTISTNKSNEKEVAPTVANVSDTEGPPDIKLEKSLDLGENSDLNSSFEEKKSEKEGKSTDKNEDVSIISNLIENKKRDDDNWASLNTDQLIKHSWSRDIDRYKCLLCLFTGKNIVHHYKMNHPSREILISRFKASDAKIAIEEAKSANIDASPTPIKENTLKFNCRFCYFSTEGATNVVMEAFYDHCTTHTGEYRFRCKSCGYVAVARSSMRTHYYKVCRKFSDTYAEATTEDEVPTENSIYGYVCSHCYFVQLKESNLKKHLKVWHENDPTVEIIRINMSTNIDLDTNDEIIENKPDVVKKNSADIVELDKDEAETSENSEKQVDTVILPENNTRYKQREKSLTNANVKEIRSRSESLRNEVNKAETKLANSRKSRPSQSEIPVIADKLSVFVCPPELENKEVEIQLERKKKMQEIIKNISIHKNKKGLSIIDKLRDKMETNLQMEESMAPIEETSVDRPPTIFATPESANKENSTLKLAEDINDKQNDLTLTDIEGNKADEVLTDPLAITNDERAAFESDMETSDNEATRESTAVYESDSSSEQSDNEPPTDVNTILKETSTMNTSSKDSMMTTIQRLVAQLQSKPLETCKNDSFSKDDKDASSPVPAPPNVVPITNVKSFLGKEDSTYKEVVGSSDKAEPPKNFIRLRRLSGDMLSARTQSEDDKTDSKDESQTEAAAGILQTDAEEECSFLKIENVVSLAPRSDGADSPIINDIRKAVETSPAKNKSGISLLKKTSPPLVLKRLNTVAIASKSLTKSKVMQSAPEKLKFISLKVPASTAMSMNYVPIVPKPKTILESNKRNFSIPTSTSNIVAPIPSHASENLKYTILKVVRTPNIVKMKDSVAPNAIKMKSAIAYHEMLKPTKLGHLFKCMARNCTYSSDFVFMYKQHFELHAANPENQKSTPPYDFQKCAYCYMVLDSWMQMHSHIMEKHAHCRYQCNMCFYRAVVPSHVQIHQSIAHSNKNGGILMGKLIKEIPQKEDINRGEFVYPYVCQHDCGKRYYVPELFSGHLMNEHLATARFLKCHLCSMKCLKIDQLIAHYKIHGLYKYQCVYCLNGADTFPEMQTHLSLLHCNRLPQILERRLPPQVQKNLDVIDQLIMRTVDEASKVLNEIETDNNAPSTSKESNLQDARSSPSAMNLIDSDVSKEKTNLDSNGLNALENSTSKSISNMDNIDTITTAPRITNVFSQCITTSATISEPPALSIISTERYDSNQKNKSSGNKIFLPAEKTLDKSLEQIGNLQETNLALFPCTNDESNAVDPLELPSELNCSDEFINVNLLDNPDVLKTVKDRPPDVLLASSSDSNGGEKAEDSDVEILENVDNVTSTDGTVDNSKDKKDDNETNKKNNDDQFGKNEERTQVGNDNSNESTSGGDNSNNSNTKVNKFLTLEDIKDTGFTGTKLYRCGYEKCDYGAPNAVALKSHVKDCSLADENKNLSCAHCKKRFMKIGFLLEHLKIHGLKRFGCSLCKMRCTVSYQAMLHMRTKHKFPNSKLVPADPENPSADGLFVVQPIRSGGERKGKKRKNIKTPEKDSEKSIDSEKSSFSPDEIDLLPRQAIYNREVQCAVCPYTTKVRTNIIRHLQLHAKDETVPESGPVNPVPCLDKKERMFDKMVNLASSSHQNGRMGGKTKDTSKDNDEDCIPKYVPEHKRYVCGVAECNYLTVDEAMLRYHLKALHSEEPYFRCPHCPPPVAGQETQNIAIDKMGVHLKMHDVRLYKCSHCNHHHYHRHVVERHLTDKHPEKRPFVKVIRELETTDNVQKPVQETVLELEEGTPDPDGNHWKCNICDYKCVYKAEMATHAANAHDEKCQFKCTLCTFKTSGKILFEQHINSKHTGEANADFILVYQRIKGVNKKSTENLDQSIQEEPFDTTPLWRRDMPRIRHIRGILLEEEDENVSSDSSSKAGKRKSDVELNPVKPAKIKPGKSASLDENKQSKEKSKRSLSCEKIYTNSEDSKTNSGEKSTKGLKPETSDEFNDPDVGKFGPYGKPYGNMYVCTLCNQFRTKYKHDMRDHLYRELNYARWHCKDCGFLSVNRNALLRHFTKRHPSELPNYVPLSPDNVIEEWVSTLLKRQMNIMKGISNVPNTSPAYSSPIPESSNTPKTQAALSKPVETVDLSNIQDEEIQDMDSDDDSRDNDDDLIIDLKEDNVEEFKDTSIEDEDKPAGCTTFQEEKPLECKHCKMRFARWRGFKLHVQLTHLKRFEYLCFYCDRSTNSETLIRQHIRSKHPGCAEKVIHNPSAGGPELTDEFWEKEYGLICSRKNSKKRKRRSDESEERKPRRKNSQNVCSVCGFRAMNLAALKSHIRVHTKNVLRCAYCTFSGSVKAEMWEHWEINHPNLPYKVEDTIAIGASSSKKAIIEECNGDVRDEVDPCDTTNKLNYCCDYCTFRSRSLDSLKKHWDLVHKDSKIAVGSSGAKVEQPFKYRKISIPTSDDSKMEYIAEPSGSKQTGWTCQWCDEFCDTEGAMKAHQTMYHSHLPFRFKRSGEKETCEWFNCPECSFTTMLTDSMRKHVARHIDLFKCKYCDRTFGNPSQVTTHSADAHPGLEAKIESIKNYEELVERLMMKVTSSKKDGNECESKQSKTSMSKTSKHAVAKKSTTKSILYVHPVPSKTRAVARKSTNPLPRYPPGINFNTDMVPAESSNTTGGPFSYYGIPSSPVNLEKLNTSMVVGGHRMKVNCTTLAQLININPRVVLNDIRYDVKYKALF